MGSSPCTSWLWTILPWFEPGPLGWHTSALTTELQEVRKKIGPEILGCPNVLPFCLSLRSEKIHIIGLDAKKYLMHNNNFQLINYSRLCFMQEIWFDNLKCNARHILIFSHNFCMKHSLKMLLVSFWITLITRNVEHNFFLPNITITFSELLKN